MSSALSSPLGWSEETPLKYNYPLLLLTYCFFKYPLPILLCSSGVAACGASAAGHGIPGGSEDPQCRPLWHTPVQEGGPRAQARRLVLEGSIWALAMNPYQPCQPAGGALAVCWVYSLCRGSCHAPRPAKTGFWQPCCPAPPGLQSVMTGGWVAQVQFTNA